MLLNRGSIASAVVKAAAKPKQIRVRFMFIPNSFTRCLTVVIAGRGNFLAEIAPVL